VNGYEIEVARGELKKQIRQTEGNIEVLQAKAATAPELYSTDLRGAVNTRAHYQGKLDQPEAQRDQLENESAVMERQLIEV
jgi:hypothetical protein